MVDGWRQLGNSSGLRYGVSLGIAPVFRGGELLPFDLADPGMTGNRTAGSVSIAYYPDFVGVTNFGAMGGYADIKVRPDTTILSAGETQIRQSVVGLQGNWENDDWHLFGAAYYVDNRSTGSGIRINGAFVSGYLQSLYNLGEGASVYGRLEWTRNPETSYLRLLPLYVFQRELLGVRWDVFERQAVHIELSSNRIVGDNFSELRVQWSAAFP
jgi:hypothetical protein